MTPQIEKQVNDWRLSDLDPCETHEQPDFESDAARKPTVSGFTYAIQDGGNFYITNPGKSVSVVTYPRERVRDWDIDAAARARAWFEVAFPSIPLDVDEEFLG